MRLVIQKVNSASVLINDSQYCSIGQGLLVLVGFCDSDTDQDFEWAIKKLINLKLFTSKLSLKDMNGELLIVSQFTLFASLKKGNRPSWSRAAKPELATKMYQHFIKMCELQLGSKIKTGLFGADMQVQLINNGPTTLIIDTNNKE
tara:strand:- start:659 stop:1096 length:438 start_codon:yes stop_codon:yes gene_type:complete